MNSFQRVVKSGVHHALDSRDGCAWGAVASTAAPKFYVFFLFFYSYLKFCFQLRPKAEAISSKIARIPKDMAATSLHPVQPIIKPVETVGENPGSKTSTKCPGDENYPKIYKKLATKGKHLPKTQEETQQ